MEAVDWKRLFFCGYIMKMGTSFKKAIFEEHIQEGLVGWARQAKKRTGLRKSSDSSTQVQVAPKESESSATIQLANAGQQVSSVEEIDAGEIEPVIHQNENFSGHA